MRLSEKSRYQLKLFKEAEKMLEKDLCVEKLVKDVRDIKIIVKEQFNHRFTNELQYHQRNVIDLDSVLAKEQNEA